MFVRMYGVLVLIAGLFALRFAWPPVGFSGGTLLFMYIGGFSAICTGLCLIFRGEAVLRLLNIIANDKQLK